MTSATPVVPDSDDALADAVVIGAGPAGLLLARECARRSLNVVIVAEEPERAWDRQLSTWAQELPADVPHTWIRARWPSVRVAGSMQRVVEAGYVAFDTERMQAELLSELRSSSYVRLIRGVVAAQNPATAVASPGSSTPRAVRVAVEPVSGTPLTVLGHVVVDATGSGALVDAGAHGSPRLFQTAFGLEVTLASPWTRGAWLMDFRPSEGPSRSSRPTTFAYILPFTPTRVLFEETVLIGEDAMSPERLLSDLQGRLERRMALAGASIVEVHRVERCRIPMDAPIRTVPPHSPLRGGLIAFGAAAGYTHPATGYQIGLTLRRAPLVADAIATVHGRPLAARGSELDDAVWPAEARASHALHQFGASSLTGLSPAATAEFFDTFFSLPAEQAIGYLARTISHADLRRTMWAMFRKASWRTQLRLQTAALRDPSGVLRGIFVRGDSGSPSPGAPSPSPREVKEAA